MLKYYNYDVVFSEIPGHVTLAVNITGCPLRCPGCHSPMMREDIGEPLDCNSLKQLLERYVPGVTCVCFMGGDSSPDSVMALARYAKRLYPSLKTGWYSGSERSVSKEDFLVMDYIKVGPYIQSRGPLTNPDTNQRMYRMSASGEIEDITEMFYRR